MSCKLDKVKGIERKQAVYWEMQTGTDGLRHSREQGIVRAGTGHCAWSEELSPGLRLEPGVCPHFLFL